MFHQLLQSGLVRSSASIITTREFASISRRNTVARKLAKEYAGTKRRGNYDYTRPTVINWDIVSGDTVQIVNGKEKGKIGKVLSVNRIRDELIVSGVNVQKTMVHQASLIKQATEKELPRPISYYDVGLVDPKTGKATEVIWDWKLEGEQAGTKVRISTTSGEEIPKPVPAIRKKRMGILGRLDTIKDDVLKVTYEKHPFFGKSIEERKESSLEKKKERIEQHKARMDQIVEALRTEKQVQEFLKKMTPEERKNFEEKERVTEQQMNEVVEIEFRKSKEEIRNQKVERILEKVRKSTENSVGI